MSRSSPAEATSRSSADIVTRAPPTATGASSHLFRALEQALGSAGLRAASQAHGWTRTCSASSTFRLPRRDTAEMRPRWLPKREERPFTAAICEQAAQLGLHLQLSSTN